MYTIRLKQGGRERLFPHKCTHLEVEVVDPSSPVARDGRAEPGVELELVDGTESRYVRLPRDADHVYVMNERGATVADYHWPLDAREVARERRAS